MISILRYIDLDFLLEFETPAFFDIYPSFALRSVLGKWLREMHCVCRGDRCLECPFKKTCAFAFILETPIEKHSESLRGRDRASHPFRIIGSGLPGQTAKSLSFRIQLIGKGTDFVPHVVFAFREAGKAGLFRQRAKYRIANIMYNGQDILAGDRIRTASLVNQDASIDDSLVTQENRSLKIVCNTPLRFKTRGNYSSDFQAGDFLEACVRRARMLTEFFGEPDISTGGKGSKAGPPPLSNVNLLDRRLRWVEYVHWSARQKTRMMLGGYVGGFSVHGTAPAFHWQALSMCGPLGAGKSTSFGFGDISICDRPESGG
ncbi:MAG TPA: CRISPR system precrRNA processing endoribonuclease RAMP protein Cas6 [Magnetospirillaceae bacterium]|nr:CRISPR system precrRNA processing endoribonuclease RAMP protein Cas6 [Magnetospirillaceae bacterium]